MTEQATDDTRNTTFALVYRLIELALILPVATATVERAFSAMKIIKTDTRNKMGDEWLTYRMTCYIERDVFASITNDDILQYFQELKFRLKKLPKLSSTSSYGMLHSNYLRNLTCFVLSYFYLHFCLVHI